MSEKDLSDPELKIAASAARRYRRPFYRWGHLLGWLMVPLVVLYFVPAFARYRVWINGGIILCIFVWYYVNHTRVIGKLAAGADIDRSQLAEAEQVPRGIRILFYRPTLAILMALLPISVFLVLAAEKKSNSIPEFFLAVWAMETVLAIILMFVAAAASYVFYFLGNKSAATRLTVIWLGLAFWGFFVSAMILGKIYAGK
jgi:hypothetical protein